MVFMFDNEKEKNYFKKSLDINDDSIIKYIPYLLKDLWELGGCNKVILDLVKKHQLISKNSQVIDLCCGKGSAIIALATNYSGFYYGVDIIKEFIQEGKEKIKDIDLKGNVTLIADDISNIINQDSKYDLIIFGYDTEILGTIKESLDKIQKIKTKNGSIIFETVYKIDDYDDNNFPTKKMLEKEINNCNLSIKDMIVWEQDYLISMNIENNIKIKKRVDELINFEPDKKQLFLEFYENQLKESNILDNYLRCVSILLI